MILSWKVTLDIRRSVVCLITLPDGRLLIMTPIDPVFLMLPLLRAATPVSLVTL